LIVANTDSSTVHPAQRKLQRRRVTSGWWIDVYDLIPEFVVYQIKPYHSSDWQAKAYGLVMSFLMGTMAYMLVVLFFGALILGDGLQNEISLQDYIGIGSTGLACVAFYLFVSLAQPASQSNASFISVVHEAQPELIPIAAKWAAKRGFLTARDLYLLMECCQDMQGSGTPAERWRLFHCAHARWEDLCEKSQQKKSLLREERNAIIADPVLVPHIQAITMDTNTPMASAESKPRARL
jgi:hypothetical protein